MLILGFDLCSQTEVQHSDRNCVHHQFFQSCHCSLSSWCPFELKWSHLLHQQCEGFCYLSKVLDPSSNNAHSSQKSMYFSRISAGGPILQLGGDFMGYVHPINQYYSTQHG